MKVEERKTTDQRNDRISLSTSCPLNRGILELNRRHFPSRALTAMIPSTGDVCAHDSASEMVVLDVPAQEALTMSGPTALHSALPWTFPLPR